nr:hypothetical protein [Frankia sp. Cas3]
MLPAAGLRRGSTVAVSGSTSFLLAVLGVPSQAGVWCAMVGFASLGVVAAADAGIVLDRFVLVPEPGQRWQAVTANQVLACTQAARSFGVRPGLRRREAQGRCPSLVVLPDDPGRDARVFEPVIAAVESVVPGVEVVRPGECVVASGGATRYFGGDAAVARAVHGAVSGAGGLACGVGVADGPFVAVLAAHRNVIVKPDASRDFLASLPVETLRRPELADLLRRLGLPTSCGGRWGRKERRNASNASGPGCMKAWLRTVLPAGPRRISTTRSPHLPTSDSRKAIR